MNARNKASQLRHRRFALAWLTVALSVSSVPAAITVSPPPDTGSGSNPPAAATNTATRAIALAEVVKPLRLTLELRDGSRIIGVPAITNLQVRSSFGVIGIELNRLQTLQFIEGKDASEFLLQNGDKVSGVLNLETVEMKTSFGPVKIPVAAIRRLAVNPGGKSRGGLVLHYGFDQDENNLVRDKSGQGHDGKLLGAQWVERGKFGGGVNISGGVQHVSSTKTEQLRLDDYSVALWVKRSNPNSTSDGPYASGLVGATGKTGLLVAEPDGRIHASRADGSRAPFRASVADLLWHHLVLVRQGKTATLFLDGEPAGELETDLPCDLRPGLDIGGASVGYPFVGTLDEVMIFDRPLSAEEAKQLANPNP